MYSLFSPTHTHSPCVYYATKATSLTLKQFKKDLHHSSAQGFVTLSKEFLLAKDAEILSDSLLHLFSLREKSADTHPGTLFEHQLMNYYYASNGIEMVKKLDDLVEFFSFKGCPR